MKCKICGRKGESGLCKLHQRAHRNLLENYEAWKKSMNVSWRKYLEEILKNSYAGVWVKEVAQNLLASGPSEEEDELAGNQVGKV